MLFINRVMEMEEEEEEEVRREVEDHPLFRGLKTSLTR